LAELTSITGERSSARRAAEGEPRTARAAAKAAATTHLEHVERAEFIVTIPRTVIRNPGSWSLKAAEEFTTPAREEGKEECHSGAF
jgi:hypothetical protein